AAPAGAEGVSLLPYFAGERTPNLPDATATLSGLSESNTTRENVARAAVEGMLAGLAVGVDALRGHGIAVNRLFLVGGGAQSAAVRAIAPLVFGVPIEVPEPAEYVAIGAALQAADTLALQ
ncbi:MAG TPA: FGGY-family carbohydrate kinase, partial [Microbacteriaceae bacterium]|nr:FGGY-family carbohydrate kinase [Microbacteriaceae bacterium]